MTKKIKLGLSAMVAFAMMFATTMSVVAQEKVNASNDKVEVKESVKAMMLAKTMENVKSEIAQKKTSEMPITQRRVESKIAVGSTEHVDNLHWYRKIGPDNYVYDGSGPSPETSCPEGEALLCAAGFETLRDEEDITDIQAENSPYQVRYNPM